jgi:hypothetical protein
VKMKVQQLMDATMILNEIIKQQRPMPQKGKYRLARMHAKLWPEFKTINDQRDAMIKAYDCKEMVENPEYKKAFKPTAENPMPHEGNVTNLPARMIESGNYIVPPEHLEDFNKQWLDMGSQEIEVDVEPMPIDQFDMGDRVDGALEANELVILGDLVAA